MAGLSGMRAAVSVAVSLEEDAQAEEKPEDPACRAQLAKQRREEGMVLHHGLS